MRIRLVAYLVLGCLASSLQFGFYDCSELPALSLAAGALTIVTALVVIDRVYFTSVSARSAGARVCPRRRNRHRGRWSRVCSRLVYGDHAHVRVVRLRRP